MHFSISLSALNKDLCLWLPTDYLSFFQMSFHQPTINPLTGTRYQNCDLLFPLGYSGNRSELVRLDQSTLYIRFLMSRWFPLRWLCSKLPVEIQYTISLVDKKAHQFGFSLVLATYLYVFPIPSLIWIRASLKGESSP